MGMFHLEVLKMWKRSIWNKEKNQNLICWFYWNHNSPIWKSSVTRIQKCIFLFSRANISHNMAILNMEKRSNLCRIMLISQTLKACNSANNYARKKKVIFLSSYWQGLFIGNVKQTVQLIYKNSNFFLLLNGTFYLFQTFQLTITCMRLKG